MKKEQKEQLNHFLKLLAQAHNEVRKAAERRNTPVLLQLLSDCQTGAIQMGELIEAVEGADCPAISQIERYCETVYQIYADAAADRALSGSRTYKTLRQALSGIRASVKNDIKVRWEAVFLPYKASMWDSMESVWRAAAADENCDAYVIPIPYYDKNPDGSLRESHYEGHSYPKDVPVVDYRSYDFEKRRPDMVFIHNPYDDCNFVTSVDPAFYSWKLKQSAGLLVYIPYFSTGGNGAQSFSGLPAYDHIDYIVIQTERERQCFPTHIRDKLLPLGSPKFDRVLNCRPEGLPPGWRERITGKIFFYNTSIGEILTDGEIVLKKLISAFDTFAVMDATLLWRPHPLLKSTLSSMRPELLPLYERAVAKFQQLKHGILDTTPDVDLSVQLADAYIGGPSSVMQLFGVSGKPIFFINVHIEPDAGPFLYENIEIMDCTQVSGVFWAVAKDRNCLISFGMDGEIREAYKIPQERIDGPYLYSSVQHDGDRLYLIPYKAEALAIFDLKSKTFRKLRLPKLPSPEPVHDKFFGSVLHNRGIYMIPSWYPALVHLNCATEELTFYTVSENSPFSLHGSVLLENRLLIAAASSNHVHIMDLETGERKTRSVGIEGDTYACMAGNDRKMILCSHAGRKLLCWDLATGETKELTDYPEGWDGTNLCFFKAVCLKDSVFVFPREGNQILKISLDSLRMEAFAADVQSKRPAQGKLAYSMAKELDDGRMLAQSTSRRGLDLFDQDGWSGHIPLRMTPNDLSYSPDDLFCQLNASIPYAAQESIFYSLEMFIRYVSGGLHSKDTQLERFRSVSNHLDGSCGAEVYRTIVQKMLEPEARA